jgi:hypothetical protein
VDFSETRDFFGIIFQIPRLRVKFEETEGPKCKMSEIGFSGNCFPKGKPVDRVHESVDHRSSGPPWTGLRHRPEDLTGARPTGASVYESSPRLHRKEEEFARVRSGASPEVEERRGGRATTV